MTGSNFERPWGGSGRLHRAKGDPLPLAVGQEPVAGDHLLASGGAVVALAGGGHLILEPGTDLRLADPASAWTLSAGALRADLPPRPQPLVITTPHGTATILGTAFRLALGADDSALDVQSGTVALADHSQRVVQVTAGRSARLATGAAPLLLPAPRYQATCAHGAEALVAAGWEGLARPDGLAPVHKEAESSRYGKPIFQITTPRLTAQALTFGPGDRLRIRCRIAQATTIPVTVVMDLPDGNWLGNTKVQWILAPGEQERAFAWEEFTTAQGAADATLAGNRIRLISLVDAVSEHGLRLLSLALEPAAP